MRTIEILKEMDYLSLPEEERPQIITSDLGGSSIGITEITIALLFLLFNFLI